MFAAYVTALLCLVSVSHSAPLACEELVRPLDQLDRNILEGRWELVAGSMKDAAYQEKFKSRDSASVYFANNGTSFRRIFSSDGNCEYMNSNITFEGSSFTFAQFNITVTLLHTSCQDCVVMRFDNESKELQRTYLFSRRREVEEAVMEEFKAQAQCLNILPPVVKDPTKKLCSEHIAIDSDTEAEEPTQGQKA